MSVSRGERTAQDMKALSAKLAAGARTLARLPANPEAGVSPRDEILRLDGVRLYRYRGGETPRDLPPLLIVYALVNRPYMLDLQQDRSFIGALLRGGREVYLVDWGYPGTADRGLGLDDYVTGYLHRCVEHLCRARGVPALDVVGVCQGGTLSLCYTALEPERVRQLALLVTPVDFQAEGFLLARWIEHVDVERLVDTLGNVPGSMLNWAFLALKPVSLSGLKALDLIELMDRPADLATFALMERWLQDSPDQAGRAFREFVDAFFRRNALIRGGLRIGGRAVDLARVRQPVLNVYAHGDHIVPPAASIPLSRLMTPGTVLTHAVDGGHIGVFTSRRTGGAVPHALCRWFEGQSPAA